MTGRYLEASQVAEYSVRTLWTLEMRFPRGSTETIRTPSNSAKVVKRF